MERELFVGLLLSQRLSEMTAADDAPPSAARPWLRWYGSVPASLSYPDETLYEAVAASARARPDAVAWDFMDTEATYRQLVASIDACANGLAALGLKMGERILIAMPTVPQGGIAFYAANKLGAVPAMVHPLSTVPELEHYLNATGARAALTLDAFYGRFAQVRPRVPLETLILARIPDYLSPLKAAGFALTKGRKIPKVPADPRIVRWKDLLDARHPSVPRAPAGPDDPAAILFSGGTSSHPKGIVLSNRNFVADGMQIAAWGGLEWEGAGACNLADFPWLRAWRLRERNLDGGWQGHSRAACSARRSPRSSSAKSGRRGLRACLRCSKRYRATLRCKKPILPAWARPIAAPTSCRAL